ncbi:MULTISPECIES: hypothetical protein [Virgibacillus]|uniref:Transporter n=1 Tax=Virgibacillus pantothenticus TaxID=1473 RepID=A0A0L0QK53_VIRPA|nr:MULTISPECIES: hypothetical protein [Virgibacillus]API92800.1 hypothetical protein BKP57_13880 [Virgibacillus sp. 6R]KNE18962.1 hypothetical protein AFK71_10310 [Virgibacillus pantothenticus]MBS7428309.1 hypothetical protein [Virgibacillus sp. 19R1-5]MBU8565258.1 hypothetical protein [Virgibacillus pantothenticus]MBU8599523.1 hypothetical protein [Virgibacillus pantothenticus]
MHFYNDHYDPSLDEQHEFPFSTLENVFLEPRQTGGGFGPPGPPPGFPGSGGPPGFPGTGGVIPGFPTIPGVGGGGQPPSAPPPAFTPQISQVQTFAVDPGAIRNCLFRYTYIWLRRSAFWFFPTFVGRNSIAGFRWTGFNWVYFGIDLNRIQSFQCF